jgi:hypothetical protein
MGQDHSGIRTRPRSLTPPQQTPPPQQPHNGVNFQAIALGQATGPLVRHDTITQLPPDATVVSLTPQQLKERSAGQTRRLFGPEPMPQLDKKELEVGEAKEVRAFGLIPTGESVCRIRNLDPKSPLVAALGVYFTIEAIDGAQVEVKADKSVEVLKHKMNSFSSLVSNLRSFNIDDEDIASTIKSGVILPSFLYHPFDRESPAEAIGYGKIGKLIDCGLHDVADLLEKDVSSYMGSGKYDQGYNKNFELHQRERFHVQTLETMYEGLVENCMERGIDLKALGILSNYNKDSLRSLFCIDLCTREKLDPLQAGRIVVRYLKDMEKPLPYQDKVMDCLCAMIETPEEAERAVVALVGSLESQSPVVEAWLMPLRDRIAEFDDRKSTPEFMEALEALRSLGTLEFVMKGDDVAELGFVMFQPIGHLDEETIWCLKAVVETGAKTTAGLSFAVAAFELLASDAKESNSGADVMELKKKLQDDVKNSPLKLIRERAEEVAKRLDAVVET